MLGNYLSVVSNKNVLFEEYFDYTVLPLSMSIPLHAEFVSCSFGNHLSGFMHQSVSTACLLSFTDAIVSACQQAVGFSGDNM